jgi:predicted Zn-dependent protease
VPYRRSLLAAQGYAELKMFEDALDEMAALPPEAWTDPAAAEVRIVILTQARKWQEALDRSSELCRLLPEAPAGFIHAAFCLHGLGRSAEAKETLLNGPASLQQEPTYHYNLACYECALGNIEEARRWLEQSFALDKMFREFAKTDPDLEPLRR